VNKKLLIGILLFALGLINMLFLYYFAENALEARTYRFEIPAERDLLLEKGTYKVFKEILGSFGAYAKTLISINIKGIQTTGDAAVWIKQTPGLSTYSANDKKGISIGIIKVQKDGLYKLNVEYEKNLNNSSVNLVLIRGYTKLLFLFVLMSIFLVGLPCFIGISICWRACKRTSIINSVFRTMWDITGIPHPVTGSSKHKFSLKRILIITVLGLLAIFGIILFLLIF